jgi:hypothetical protein
LDIKFLFEERSNLKVYILHLRTKV